MSLQIVEENNAFSIYYCSDTNRELIGAAPTRQDAEMACRKLSRSISTSEPKVTLTSEAYRRLGRYTKRNMQVKAMELDPDRCWMFFEQLLMLNYALHMMADSFDELEDLFSAGVDASTKQIFKNAQRDVNKLLDSFLNSQIQGTADDYCIVSSKALYIKARIMPLIAYVMSNEDLGEHQWRLNELDKVLDNIMPDSYIEDARKYISNRIINSFKGEE